MRFGSACSGIEAASVAWRPLGWEAAWFAEIDRFPSAVLAHHYPDVPNLGDITTISEADLERCGPIDVLVGGTPCQSFSVAGLRAGLDDPRGQLVFAFLRLVRLARPRWVLWENVPDVLSSWTGTRPPGDLEPGREWVSVETSDFGCFLSGLAELGYGFAYRVLDAQYAGLAQRRERVFVVGRAGDWAGAAAVLFEQSSCAGHPPPRREAGAARPPPAAGCAAFGGNRGRGALDVSTTLSAHAGPHGRLDYESETFVVGPLLAGGGTRGHRLGADEAAAGHVVVSALMAGDGGPDDNAAQAGYLVPVLAGTLRADSHDASEDGSGRQTLVLAIQDCGPKTSGQGGSGIGGDLCYTLDTTGRQGVAILPTAINARQDPIHAVDHSQPLDTDGGSQVVALAENSRAEVRLEGGDGTRTGSLSCGGGKLGQGMPAVLIPSRETPPQEADIWYDAGDEPSGAGHAKTHEADTVGLLSALRREVGEEAFTAWGLGVLGTLPPAEVLRPALHGLGFRCPTEPQSGVVYNALSRTEDRAVRPVLRLWRIGGDGCPPQGWQPREQLARQLAENLSELPRQGSPALRFMRDLWQAGEGARVLRSALSALQEARRSACGEGQSAHRGGAVRRLTADEWELLQGFPQGYTLVPYRRGMAKDGPRYKAIGNSMAVPLIRKLGERMASVDACVGREGGQEGAP